MRSITAQLQPIGGLRCSDSLAVLLCFSPFHIEMMDRPLRRGAARGGKGVRDGGGHAVDSFRYINIVNFVFGASCWQFIIDELELLTLNKNGAGRDL